MGCEGANGDPTEANTVYVETLLAYFILQNPNFQTNVNMSHVVKMADIIQYYDGCCLLG
jgi:hypothetical protein